MMMICDNGTNFNDDIDDDSDQADAHDNNVNDNESNEINGWTLIRARGYTGSAILPSQISALTGTRGISSGNP